MYKICSKLTTMKLWWRYWFRSGFFIVANFEHISHIILAFPLLALKKLMPDGGLLIFVTKFEEKIFLMY